VVWNSYRWDQAAGQIGGTACPALDQDLSHSVSEVGQGGPSADSARLGTAPTMCAASCGLQQLRGAGGMATALPPGKTGINSCSGGDIKAHMQAQYTHLWLRPRRPPGLAACQHRARSGTTVDWPGARR
jgi:hypothetical protein